MPKFSKKAKTHAALSKKRTKKMIKSAAHRSGPVTISFLPGYGTSDKILGQGTKFPFTAWINDQKVCVSRSAYGIEVDYE